MRPAAAIENSEKVNGESSWILVFWYVNRHRGCPCPPHSVARGFLLGKWGVFTLALADHASKYDRQLVSTPINQGDVGLA